ncbi:protein BglB [Hyaloraphidium curvatum]|nr:protein BglB [Hyaloraphidium curvatum]
MNPASTRAAVAPELLDGSGIPQLVARMTAEEKCGLLSGRAWWDTRAVPRLGIPSLYMTDGPHGVRKTVVTGKQISSEPATCFPTACALACTWDTALMEKLGATLALEARSQDVGVLLGPGINIKRSPLCGRNFEYLSEDPFLSGSLAAAYVKGLQANGVGCSLKHFAVNNQESSRMGVSAQVDQRTLREIYLPAFEQVVKEADPWTVMCSYNRINGVYASEDPWLLTELLRDEWGFKGLVVSDWGAVNTSPAAVSAGLDLEMPSTGKHSVELLLAALRDGKIKESDVDTACVRVLRLIHRSLSHPTARLPKPVLPVDEHHALARRMAADSIVLLKNDGLLPLDPKKKQRIAVVGAFAADPRYQGAGSSKVNPTKVDCALDEIRKALDGTGSEVSYSEGFKMEGGTDAQLVADAVRAVKDADTVLLFLGLPAALESEGFDRQSIFLPASQLALLRAVAAVQPRTAVCLSNGGVVSTAEWSPSAAAVLECWLGGQASGGAVADVLFGAVNPSGRLSETLPLRIEDTPCFLHFPGDVDRVEYREGVFVGYRHYESVGVPVAHEFGFGLSYTTFEYSDLALSSSELGPKDELEVSFTVRNTGSRAGREVAQLYVAPAPPPPKTLLDPPVDRSRPAKELRAFAKTRELQPGETERVSLRLGRRAFSKWEPNKGWTVEISRFLVMVGASCGDIRIKAEVKIFSDPVPFSRDTPIRRFVEQGNPEVLAVLKPALPFDVGVARALLRGDQPEGEADTMMVASFVGMPLHKATGWSRGFVTEALIKRVVDLANGKGIVKL